MNEFALGQNFIRDYGIIYNWVIREDGSTEVAIYLGPANDKNSIFSEVLVMVFTLSFLSIYVGYFSVLKFRRIRFEQQEYNKIKHLKLTDDVKVEVLNAIKEQQADIDYVQGKEGATIRKNPLLKSIHRHPLDLRDSIMVVSKRRNSSTDVAIDTKQSFQMYY